MASKLPSSVPYLDSLDEEIKFIFDRLINQLIERRDTLLHTLSQLREDYIKNEAIREIGIGELEIDQQNILKLAENPDLSISKLEKLNDAYHQTLQKLNSIKHSCPIFQYDSLSKLQQLISEFGQVSEWVSPPYSMKKYPIRTAGKKGNGNKQLEAADIVSDETNNRLYIADYENSRIQILSSKGDFISRFGKDIMSMPWGIAVTKEHIYTSDLVRHVLFMFNKADFSLVRTVGRPGAREGEFNEPRGIAVDRNGDVFVAESYNHRVSIFSSELIFKRCFGNGMLFKTRDVKLRPDCVVVLDEGEFCVHFFTRQLELMRSCIQHGRGSCFHVMIPHFFCLDPLCNIFISDMGNHFVKMYFKSGHLFHTIGKLGDKKGDLVEPLGINVSSDGVVSVVSDNPSYPLQWF